MPSQVEHKHQVQVLGENTLSSSLSNSSCCLPLNLLRVCWYKVLLCRACRFLQLSIVWPILWQKPHVIAVCDETAGEELDSLLRGSPASPLPRSPKWNDFPFPLRGNFPFPLPFPLGPSKLSCGATCLC